VVQIKREVELAAGDSVWKRCIPIYPYFIKHFRIPTSQLGTRTSRDRRERRK
jgi:hypothetical protein